MYMLIPIETNATINYRWYFAACFLILMNYYDAAPNLIFLNLVTIAVLFGIQPKVQMEELTWKHAAIKFVDLVQFNIYFMLFAVFVTYLDKLHLKVAAQAYQKDGIIIKSDSTNEILFANQQAVNFLEKDGIAKPKLHFNLGEKLLSKVNIERLHQRSIEQGLPLSIPDETTTENLFSLE